MKKTWNVKIDEQMYNVELKNKKLIVNGESLKLKNFKKKTGLVHEEYEIMLGEKPALLVIKTVSAPQLVVDNVDCATGEEYVPIKLPKWSYIFIILHFVNFLNGALGCLIGVFGIAATTSISCNRKMNVVIRVLLDVVVLVLAFALTFGIAFAVAGM